MDPMRPKNQLLMRTLALLAAGFLVTAPALAGGHGGGHGSRGGGGGAQSSARSGGGGGGHSFGRSGGGHSFSSGNHSSYRSSGGSFRSSPAARSSPGVSSRGSVSSGRNFSSSSRSSFGNRGNFRSGGNNAMGNTWRAPGGMTGNIARTPPSSSRGDSGATFRSHPRPGFTTTRPDFGTDFNSRDGLRYRPGQSTGRPDFSNGRSNHFTGSPRGDGQRSSRTGSPRGDGQTSFRTRPDDRRSNDGRRFDHGPGFNGRFVDSDRFNGGRFHDRPGFNHGPGFNHRPGFNRGFSGHRHWHGGYWNGRFWPRVYYRPGFVAFWPVLPAAYVTYWYSGIPYYYYDDVYYTWSPARYGYVATDPPPAEESGTAEDDSAPASEPAESGAASVYVYPRNGQSEEQTSQDRFECHQWAVSQTGFDPTTATGEASTTDGVAEYRRALIACLDARGYSAN
jgi:hypothetical protein